eukprot:Gb_08587 [translate_table: standard]
MMIPSSVWELLQPMYDCKLCSVYKLSTFVSIGRSLGRDMNCTRIVWYHIMGQTGPGKPRRRSIVWIILSKTVCAQQATPAESPDSEAGDSAFGLSSNSVLISSVWDSHVLVSSAFQFLLLYSGARLLGFRVLQQILHIIVH